MDESVIMRLEKARIVRLLHEEPAFSEVFVAHLLSRSRPRRPDVHVNPHWLAGQRERRNFWPMK